jgi:RNA polymerase sigma-70 factor (ECF subfamily)
MDFWEVYDRYYSRVRAYAASMLRDATSSDDVVQETFMRAQAHLDGLRDPDRVVAWLFRIAHNVCMDYLRAQQSSHIDADVEPDTACHCEAGSVQRDLERREMSACVRDRIDHLPATDRAVVLLHDIMGLSHQEVGDVLGIDPGTAKVRLHRARTRLRTLLEDACSFEHDEENVLVCEPKVPRRQP